MGPRQLLGWLVLLCCACPAIRGGRDDDPFGCAGRASAPLVRELPRVGLPPLPPLRVWGPNHPSAEMLIRTTSRIDRLRNALEGFALPALRLFWNGSTVIVLDDNPAEEQYGLWLAAHPPYPRVVLESWPFDPSAIFPNNQKIYAKKARRLLPRGRGYAEQAYSNFWADLHSEADLVLVMDTDGSLLTAQLPGLFLLGGKAIAVGTRAHPNSKSEMGRAAATRLFLGMPEVGNFMVGFPIALPRQAFRDVRCQMVEAHPGSSLHETFNRLATETTLYFHFSILFTALHARHPAACEWHIAASHNGTRGAAYDRPALRGGGHHRHIPPSEAPALLAMAYCAHALMADLPNATHDCGNSSAYRRVVESFLSDTTVRWCDQTRLLLDQHWAAVQAADWRFNATFVTELLAAARALPGDLRRGPAAKLPSATRDPVVGVLQWEPPPCNC